MKLLLDENQIRRATNENKFSPREGLAERHARFLETQPVLGAQDRRLEQLTGRVDYKTRAGVVSGPGKPIMVRFPPAGTEPAAAPKLTGTVSRLWRQYGARPDS